MRNRSWFYSVTWYEGTIFYTNFFNQDGDALNRYRELKKREWQNKVKDLRITRYGNFVMDSTPVEEAS